VLRHAPVAGWAEFYGFPTDDTLFLLFSTHHLPHPEFHLLKITGFPLFELCISHDLFAVSVSCRFKSEVECARWELGSVINQTSNWRYHIPV
jgi:hypothetical protein